jgi:hypothetical protein
MKMKLNSIRSNIKMDFTVKWVHSSNTIFDFSTLKTPHGNFKTTIPFDLNLIVKKYFNFQILVLLSFRKNLVD